MTDRALQRIIQNLNSTLRRDDLIGETTTLLRSSLQVDRVVVFYFPCEGEGRVSYESVESDSYSIFGSTEPIDCLEDYTALCVNGRAKEVVCDRSGEAHSYGFQSPHQPQSRPRQSQSRASLVAPIQNAKRLWGLLIAQNFQASKLWSTQDVEMMEQSVQILSEDPSICNG